MVLDLNNNGFNFIKNRDSTAFYDFTGDGVRERTGWTSGADGLLAYDANGDGQITLRDEIRFKGYLAGARTDLEGLAAFDTNHDGVLSGADAKWNQFYVWQDINQDGFQTANELTTLAQRGIASVALLSDKVQATVEGNTVYGVGHYTRVDGSQGKLADVRFALSNEQLEANLNDDVSSSPLGGTVNTGAGSDQVHGGEGADVLYAGAGDDRVSGGGGNDQIYGDSGKDMIDAGAGDDLVFGGTGDDSIVGGDGSDSLNGDDGDDRLYGSNGNDHVSGDDGNDVLYGEVGNDVLSGGAGNDVLVGGEGNDWLYGGLGADLMQGDAGNDIYVVGNEFDQVIERAAGGIDTAISYVDSVNLGNVEAIVLAGVADLEAVGNAEANMLFGNQGDNYLDGGAGADTMAGGAGDDVYVVDNAADAVLEMADNQVAPGDGSGAVNSDNSVGPTFFNTYGHVGFSGTHWGVDTVKASVTYTLGSNVENLILTGSSAINATGNSLNNLLSGNMSDNVLDGGMGADTMAGGKGDDTYIVDNLSDVVSEGLNEGRDLVLASVSFTLATNVEDLTLTGSGAINATGNAGNNLLTGNSAVNVLLGGAGNDTYIVSAGDIVTEANDGGNDAVQSNTSWVLSANVENLTLTGYSAINGTGNADNNVLTGNSAANVLDGGLGADTMSGGLGDDIYLVDNLADVIAESADGGIDLVKSSVSYALSANIENLTLIGSAVINGMGNAGNNVLIGNSVANVLTGGAGDDTYIVGTGDTIIEATGGGIDSVQSNITWTLDANVENLMLLGATAINATGNAENNLLTGNSAANVLTGRAGDDTYIVTTGDTTIELADDGVDTVQSNITWTLATNVENLTLTGTSAINATGNAANNVLIGNSAANVLNGGFGADTMAGGQGNDTYVVDNAADVVTEGFNEGTDFVQSSVSYSLGINVENLTLTGTSAINATGNAASNVLIGNSGANILNGGMGADTMVGGQGNDTYVVDDIADVVTEGAGGGTDTVQSSVSYSLADNIENLMLTGTGAISGTGNAGNNTISGNSAANVLIGGEGNDVIDGGDGNDTITDTLGTNALKGGAGNDTITGQGTIEGGKGDDTLTAEAHGLGNTYIFNLGDGKDSINDYGYSSVQYISTEYDDTLKFGAGILPGAIGLARSVNDMVIKISATDQVTVKNWFTSNLYEAQNLQEIERLQFADGTVWNREKLKTLVPAAYSATANAETINGWDGIDIINGLAGNDVINGLGNNDLLDGGDGDDIMDGGDGVDQLLGGLGNDSLAGGEDNDVIDGGDGNDTITDTLGTNALKGGAGNDTITGQGTIEGGKGDDTLTAEAHGLGNTYIFNLGDGKDSINDYGYSSVQYISTEYDDTLKFGAGILPGAIGLARSVNDMVIKISATDQVTVKNWFTSNLYEAQNLQEIERLQFADGTVWNREKLKTLVPAAYSATANAETINGWDGIDIINGLAGNDVINGLGNNDLLDGGDGDDIMDGGDGVDQLLGGLGNDSLAGGEGNDVIDGGDGNDTITDTLGTNALKGGAGNDTITGQGTIEGGKGDDTLTAEAHGLGNTYIFNLGDGKDSINDYGYSSVQYISTEYDDTLKFGAGILPGAIGLARSVNDMVIKISATDQVTVKNWFTSNLYEAQNLQEIERLQFADGTVWNREKLKTLVPAAYSATANAETINGWDGIDIINGLAGNDVINGLGNNDLLDGGDGDDIMDGGDGVDQLLGGLGNDSLAGGEGNDVIDGGDGNDTITDTLGTNALKGGAGNDTITGQGTIEGGKGDDTLTAEAHGLGNTYIFNLGDGKDSINDYGYSSVQYISTEYDDTLKFGAGILPGAIGLARSVNDMVIKISATDQVTVKNWFTSNLYEAQNLQEIERLQFADGTVWNREKLKTLVPAAYSATANAETINGWDGIDIINGLAGNDVINGLGGNDVLDGGSGSDTMAGGMGDDIYVLDTASDLVVENLNEGTDLVQSSLTYSLGANVENLALTGTAVINGTGNTLNNVLTGNSANNTLDGGIGADTLIGGLGNDTYIVDNSGDVVTETSTLATEIDTVQASISFILSANAENLTLTGTAVINGTGNTLNNVLTGNSANNMLDGGMGADTLIGGMGNDTYIVDQVGDVVTENLNEGTDLVQTSVTYTLGANVENLTLTGTAVINGTGNTLNNVLTGNSANNTLSGGAGNDTLDGGVGTDSLIGGTGDDIYVVDSTTDVVTENLNEGTDLVKSSVTYTLGANAENLTLTGTAVINGTGNTLNNVLTGNSANNTLSGGAGNDTLDGGSGNDNLIGGAGDDIYVVDSTTDVATENVNEGTDLVKSSVTYTLGANAENLTLTGTAVINGTGNTLNNVLTGNSANNMLDGGMGADTLIGGMGNDTYIVDQVGDVVTENLNEGTDLVQTSVTYTLGANVENLTLTGTAVINGTGNTLNNVLTGNSGNNTLSGGAGNDTLDGGSGNDNLIGGTGDDIYVVDSTTDMVTENVNEGTDLVKSSVTYTLGANAENLTLTGTAVINGTGNTLNNVLTGNSANNMLDGGMGADTLIGGMGNDTYIVDQVGDVVTENLNEGTDLVQTSVTYTLGANVENLTLTGTAVINGTGNTLNNVLTGNSANNTLSGGAGNDTLDGGVGTDSLIGGTGDDIYVVDSTTDVVTENLNEGTDLVKSSVTYTLGANAENLTLTGTAVINGTGNTLNNVLTGNSANNTLSGGAGNDTLDGGSGNDNLIGGAGDDIYVVDSTTDVATENVNEGTDLVKSSVTYTLGANAENLTLTGTAVINGTGNTLNNVLTGNSANNTLSGGAGNDTLDGGAGTDTLGGGTGNDTYVFNAGSGADTIVENDAAVGSIDVLSVGGATTNSQLWFRHIGNNLEVDFIGTSDSMTMQNWYLGTQYQVEQIKTSDGKKLLNTDVDKLVQAMAALAPPSAGQTSLPPAYQTALAPVLTANWK